MSEIKKGIMPGILQCGPVTGIYPITSRIFLKGIYPIILMDLMSIIKLQKKSR
jgi:hypothetical protein